MISPALSRRAAVAVNALQLAGRSDEADAIAIASTDEEIEAALALTAAAWDETKHPRFGRGVREGGRFRGNGISNASDDAQPDRIDIGLRRLKNGDHFLDGNGHEYVVISESASGLGMWVSVRNVETGKGAVAKASMKVSVLGSDWQDELAKIAKSKELHVEGELAKVFDTSPSARSGATKAANEASERIGKVLTLPDDLQKIPLVTASSGLVGEGQFSASKGEDGSLFNGKIQVKPKVNGNTVTHEVGHYLDHMAISPGSSASDEGGRAEGVMTAIAGTEAGKRMDLMAGINEGSTFKMMKSGWTDKYGEVSEYPIDQNYRAYTSGRQERFARAFEQYIATKSGGPMDDYRIGAAYPLDNRTFDPGENTQAFYGWYWTDDDFVPVAEAFDEMFGGLGWSKS